MSYHRRAPRLPLRDVVDHVWAFDGHVVALARGRLFADGAMDVMFNLTDPLVTERDGRPRIWRAPWVCGPRTDAQPVQLTSRRFTIVGARIRPGSVGAVLGAPATEVAEQVVELHEFWRGFATEVHERIATARSIEARFDALEDGLERRLIARLLPRPAFAAMVAELRDSPTASIATLSRRLGVSHKHLTRLFRSHVGLGPKTFHRVGRFRALVARLPWQRGAPDWAALACAGGYADQAHLCRDFREFTGITPTRFSPAWDAPDYLPYGDSEADVGT
ncbi:MAG: AraC family transcriptional regulator [Planctomycetes bacterium]|nr:AraC family transcriptional regulator [Planctomycetota bacterium]